MDLKVDIFRYGRVSNKKLHVTTILLQKIKVMLELVYNGVGKENSVTFKLYHGNVKKKCGGTI